MSSIHALSKTPKNTLIDESRPLLSGSEGLAYDYTKAFAERLVVDALSRDLDAVILNPTAVIGPFDFKPSLAGEMMLLILKQRLPSFVPGGFNWVDVRDVAEGACRAAEHAKKGERYILSGNWHTIREIGLMLNDVSGCTLPVFDVPMWIARLGAPLLSRLSLILGKRPLYTAGSLAFLRAHRFISSEKAKRELGFESRSLSETIKDTYLWFKENGYIDNSGCLATLL